MVKKLKPLLFILLGLTLIYYFFLKKETPPISLAEDPPITKESATSPPLQTEIATSLKDIEIKSKKTETNQVKPQPIDTKAKKNVGLFKQDKAAKNLIRYELKNGYVIASGDILLGRIDPNKNKIPVSGVYQVSDRTELWHNGVIPFAIDKSIPAEVIIRIQKAMEEFHSKTAIRFVDYRNEKDAVLFDYEKDICASHVGRIGGHQQILLSEKCGETEIKHEFMHTLGFIHEQQRENRDQFVEIYEKNILEDKLLNFDVMPFEYQKIYKNLSSTFDYKSITIYPDDAFAKKSGDKTLGSKSQGQSISPSPLLSTEDLRKIEEVYVRQF